MLTLDKKPYQFFFSHSTSSHIFSVFFYIIFPSGEGTTHGMVVDIIIVKFLRVVFEISQYPVRERERAIRSKFYIFLLLQARGTQRTKTYESKKRWRRRRRSIKSNHLRN